MASFNAIGVTALALKGLLKSAVPKTDSFNPDVQLFQSKDLQDPPLFEGISIYLHRLAFNTSRRNLPPRQTPEGIRYRPSTPLDAHFLFTAWTRQPEMQHFFLGWVIRTLQDTTVLPAGFLNGFAGDRGEVFREDETVDLVGEILSAQDFVNIWGVSKISQQPSVSYVARMIFIDSEVQISEAGPAQTRAFDYAKISAG